MATDRYATRRNKLNREVKKANIDALLVTNFTNVAYLTGFSGDDSYLLVCRDMSLLISDSRYKTQIEQECAGIEVHIRKPGEPMTEAIALVTKGVKPSKLGFESNSTTVAQWEVLAEKIKSLELVPIAGLVERLRLIKDRYEIGEIRKAVRQAEKGFAALKTSLVGEMTERETAHSLEHVMRRFGANGASFESIVAVGPHSALPHARPTNTLISAAEFVLIDWGASNANGYKSDLTRMLVTGKIFPKLRKIYRVVLNAQRRGIESIRPGIRCRDVDTAARKVIAKAGYGKNFGHGLGHGIGLDIHEGPRLGPASTDELKPGMVVTVEPGIYLPGWGGIRIEDDVLVTHDGCEVLTSTPKELEEAVIK